MSHPGIHRILLSTAAALTLQASPACGRVIVVLPPLNDAPAHDAPDDTNVSPPDASTPDTATTPDAGPRDGSGDATTHDAQGDTASPPQDAGQPPVFTGTAELRFTPDQKGPPGNLLVVTVKVAGAAPPQPGHTYVLWMTGSKAAPHNFGKLPQATDFSIAMPPPLPGAGSPVALYNGALISYESGAAPQEAEAPTGPTVWQGQVAPEVWQHVRHVLVADPTGGKGYVQQAALIFAEVQAQLEIATKLFAQGAKSKTRATVEIMHNLMAGPKDDYDLDGNGQLLKNIIDVQVGLTGPEGAMSQAVMHAGLAAKMAPDNAPLQAGLSALKECESPFNKTATMAIELCAAFASGAQSSLTPTTKAVGLLSKEIDCLITAAGKLPVITLTLQKPPP